MPEGTPDWLFESMGKGPMLDIVYINSKMMPPRFAASFRILCLMRNP